MNCFRVIALFVFGSALAGCTLDPGFLSGNHSSDWDDEPRTTKIAVCHGQERAAEAQVSEEFPGFSLEELSSVRVLTHTSGDPDGEWHPSDPDALWCDEEKSTVTFSCAGSTEDIEVRFIEP